MNLSVVFDFDGTLVQSNDIKRAGFFAVIPQDEASQTAMAAILREPPGDRSEIFRHFAAKCGGDPALWVRAYSVWCEDRIVSCPGRPGADQAVAELSRSGVRMHINSATPQVFLSEVVKRRYPHGLFAQVLGGHGAKVANLKHIMAADGVAPQNLVMVGDGTDDHAAALAIGAHFIGVGGGTLAAARGAQGLLDDLAALPRMLTEPVGGAE